MAEKVRGTEEEITNLKNRLERLEFNYRQLVRRQVEMNAQLQAVNKHVEISVAKKEYK